MALRSKVGMDPFTEPPTVAGLQTAINGTGALLPQYDLTPLEFPIVPQDGTDWDDYIDEYDTFGRKTPGVAIIDQAGKIYAVRFDDYGVPAGIDWIEARIDELLNPRDAVDTVLVLDRSGSMAMLPPSGGTMPKMEILQEAAGTFIDVWKTRAVPDDRIGVVAFDSGVDQFTSSGPGGTLPLLDTDAENARTYIDGLGTGGLTCMGGGVKTALDELSSSSRAHVILFSDGMQNYGPMLADVGSDIEIRTVAPADVGSHALVEHVYGNSSVPEAPGVALSSYGPKIHTIGVGLSHSPWTDLMAEVATQTGGLQFETPAPATDLYDFFLNDLMESFKGSTPQILRHRHATYDPEQCRLVDNCYVDQTSHWLTVVLVWHGDPARDQLVCQLQAPDGTLVDLGHGRMRSTARRHVISVPLPTYQDGRMLGHAGRWRLHVMGTTSGAVPCQIFWIADDHQIHFDLKPFKPKLQVGQTLPLIASLQRGDRALSPARVRQAQVSITAPAIDFQRFLKDYQPRPDLLQKCRRLLTRRKLLQDVDLQLFALSQDPPALAKMLKTRTKQIRVEYGRGRFKGAYELTMPGMHRVRWTIDCEDRQGARIQRTRSASVYVRPRRR